ncbi:hypothetical protein, partial [Luteolibacter marinus]|uniref:hypothetical protein n=1 Tax=Luteolibacter marinus TaxID=2776705 RepID=UPI00186604B6
METIPPETLAKVLELRQRNGLEATETAVYADIEKSKCKWTLADTPRYRRAGESPLWISGKYLSSYGSCPATGEADQGRSNGARPAKAPAPRATGGKPDEGAFYKVLHGKGFAVKITQDLLTGEIHTDLPESIRKLDLQFGAMPANATGVHVTQTNPQIQVS